MRAYCENPAAREADGFRQFDENGNIVCEYTERNRSVVSLRYTPKDGTVLPITVCTYDDLQESEGKVAVRNVIFGAAYCIETIAILLIYVKKRAK